MSEPVKDLAKLPFWPALVLVATAQDAAAIMAVVAYCQRWRPSLPTPKIETCTKSGMVKPGLPRMYRDESEVPPAWRGAIQVAA